MARRTVNIRDLRAQVEAAEALGITTPAPRRPRAEPDPLRDKPEPKAKMKVVWAVCDLGGRSVATFDYPKKAEAEALAVALKARGKGNHFVRSVKEMM